MASAVKVALRDGNHSIFQRLRVTLLTAIAGVAGCTLRNTHPEYRICFARSEETRRLH